MYTNVMTEALGTYMLLAIPPGIQVTFAVLITVSFGIVFYNWLYARTLKRESGFIKAHNNRLALILRSSNISVWVYNVSDRKYAKLSADGDVESEYTPIDFSRFYDNEDFEQMRKIIFDMRDQKKASYVMRLHVANNEGESQQMVEVKLSVLTTNKQGKPEVILGMQHPYVNEHRKLNREQTEIIQYKTVFNSSLIDMTFYDEEGMLADINERACENFRVADGKELIVNGCSIADAVGFDVDLNMKEPLQCTCLIDMDRLANEGRRGKGVQLGGRIYYEVMIYPVHYDDGTPLGLFMEGRNITEMVNSYHRQQETMRQLQHATSELRASIDNINMALQVAECRLMNYYPDRHELYITTDIDKPQHRMSQIRLFGAIDEADHKHIGHVLKQMDRKCDRAMDVRFKTIFNDHSGTKMHVAFNAIPMFDAEGRLTHYFGMGRNETKLINTENELKAETQKAQETELLKNSFLLNMSYEIRTPLSSVLGFAELFETEHDAEDEVVFVNEIKKNSNQLLSLVNDVLYISRIDANMIEVKRQPTDFALVFESHCHMGWMTNTKASLKTIVENPYEHLEVVIDPELTGSIIETLARNALTYTESGSVRAKYEYRSGELDITIEDTGAGISSEDLPHLFDRFVGNRESEHGGTGLNMAIVKGLVDLMGGKIDVISTVGKGTTVWVSIPCELVNMDMKKDFAE